MHARERAAHARTLLALFERAFREPCETLVEQPRRALEVLALERQRAELVVGADACQRVRAALPHALPGRARVVDAALGLEDDARPAQGILTTRRGSARLGGHVQVRGERLARVPAPALDVTDL